MDKVIAEPGRRSNRHLIDRITLIRGDLTEQNDVDAIVSSISVDLDCSGKLNSCLIEKAGQRLDEFILENVYKPQPGDVFAVPGFKLPVKHIIYSVTPDWRDSFDQENRTLLRCYRRPLKMARRMGLKSIAFPVLGTGENGFPPQKAVRLAIEGIMARIDEQFEEVRIVCNRQDLYNLFKKRLLKEDWKVE